MTLFKKAAVYYDDTPNLDAFGRLRVSQLSTQFDGKQIHDALPLFYETDTAGSGSAAHSTTNAESTLTTSANNDHVIMQTKQRFNYRSGKSALGMMTFRNFDNETNIVKRVGYFNSSTASPYSADIDGLYFQSSGDIISFVVSKTGTATTIPQSSWNVDKLDGTGESAVNLQLGTEDGNLLLWYNYEWLGVGAVTFGFVYNNEFIIAHREDFILSDGVYMSSPNHSLRYEIRQTGAGSGTLRSMCSTFNTEGALNDIGKDGGASDDGTHLDANSTSVWYVAIAARLSTTRPDTLVDILGATLKSDTNDGFEYRVVLNPTYDSTLTYNTIDNYAIEYALGATANAVTDMGTILKAGYGIQDNKVDFDLKTALRLGVTLDGTVDEIVVVVKPHTSNLDVHRAINWRELA